MDQALIDLATATNEAKHRDGFLAAGHNLIKFNMGRGTTHPVAQNLTYLAF